MCNPQAIGTHMQFSRMGGVVRTSASIELQTCPVTRLGGNTRLSISAYWVLCCGFGVGECNGGGNGGREGVEP